MYRLPFGLIFMFFLLFSAANSEGQDVITALVEFMGKLAPGNVQADWGWNASSDPCTSKWKGVGCDSSQTFVQKIVLEEQNFTGFLDADSLCKTSTLLVLSVKKNSIAGDLTEGISGCKNLTHLFLNNNLFSGSLPNSVSMLSNLKRVDISYNRFSGELPDMSKISGLLTFLAENNQFSGELPKSDFSNLVDYNVSNNNLSGEIPDVDSHFNASRFSGNPSLCGKPLTKACPIVVTPPGKKKSKRSVSQYLMYSGYAILGLIVVLIIGYKVIKKIKSKGDKVEDVTRVVKENDSGATGTEFKNGGNRSEFSLTSAESATASSSLVVIPFSPVVNGMRFEDLLRAPADLIGSGKHGSLYRVTLAGGLTLVVKRIKDWRISRDDFRKRMQRIGQVTHPNVLPVAAYYCSKEEKLLVYEYLKNGSLFRLLLGSLNGQLFGWGSRLNMAASIAEALAFMHEDLGNDGIAHGNLKLSNILLNNEGEPCISEYGLMVVANYTKTGSLKSDDPNSDCKNTTFKVDIYGFGVILLELLTGKLVQNTGLDLGKWVLSVVEEEWTVEVFDKSLISEGASEERLVLLLQVALKCMNASPDARPSMKEVAEMINAIKEEEYTSISC